MPVFGRVVTAMATPFTDRLELDVEGAAGLAEHLVDHGTDTVLVAGTTGEAPTLHGEEPWELLGAVREAVDGRAGVMIGTGTNATDKTVAATERAQQEGADAVLVVTPYYNKPSQAGLAHHFRSVAAATDLPVLLYDIPGRTGREITVDTLVDLAGVDNIVGVKDATADPAKVARTLARTPGAPGGFEVYCGADEANLPMLAVGASGFVSVASNLIGDALAREAEVFATDPGEARRIHWRSLPVQAALFDEPNPSPLKGALRRLGLPAGPVRPPMAPASDATVEALLAALEPFELDGLGG